MNRFKVPLSARGDTLLSFLRGALCEYPSVKAIKRAIDAKKCRINGRVEFFSTHRIEPGDVIEITLESHHFELNPQILLEDEALIIYNKPAGMASEQLGNGFLVHRLDKETSGIIVIAKTKEAQDCLIGQFSKRAIEKNYLALCDKSIKREKFKVDNELGLKARYQGGKLFGKVKSGKRALTIFRVLKRGKKASLILAQPITGRTHQIRVHLKELGYPVLGDWQYAKKFECAYQAHRHLLHAYKIKLAHPLSGENLRLTAAIPKDFRVACQAIIS